VLAAAILIGVICHGFWLYFYTADLPSTDQLSDFNPASSTKARLRSCDAVEQEIAVMPKRELGRYTVAAVVAAEGKPESRSPFVSLFFRPDEQHVASYQVQLARTIACTQQHGSILKRQLQELRLANAINREFEQEELLTVYLNRIYLGSDVYGIENAARRYFGKPASHLTLQETAVLVGMIRAPRLYSSVAHPDRAAQRRNSILDDMVAQGSVTKSDAENAKAIPIQIVR
jgi:membrane carboxypeptidase/penicillin-binding protein